MTSDGRHRLTLSRYAMRSPWNKTIFTGSSIECILLVHGRLRSLTAHWDSPQWDRICQKTTMRRIRKVTSISVSVYPPQCSASCDDSYESALQLITCSRIVNSCSMFDIVEFSGPVGRFASSCTCATSLSIWTMRWRQPCHWPRFALQSFLWPCLNQRTQFLWFL